MPEEEHVEHQEVYEKDMHFKLKKCEAKIDELKAKMDEADAQTRESIHKEMENHQDLQYRAQEKLKSLMQVGKKSFTDIKTGVENAVKDLEGAVGSALLRLKSIEFQSGFHRSRLPINE